MTLKPGEKSFSYIDEYKECPCDCYLQDGYKLTTNRVYTDGVNKYIQCDKCRVVTNLGKLNKKVSND